MTIISVIICHYQTLTCYIIGTGQTNLGSRHNHDTDNDANNNCRIDENVTDIVSTTRKLSETNKYKQQTFLEEFSWDEQGFSLTSSFYSDLVHHLDDKFR